jgi:hypothetical protein
MLQVYPGEQTPVTKQVEEHEHVVQSYTPFEQYVEPVQLDPELTH